MKLACQEGLAPGETLAQRFESIEKAGYLGVEFGGSGIWERVGEIRNAFASSSLEPATICAGFGGCPLDSTLAERQKADDDIKRILTAGGEIGVVGMVLVPVFGPPRIGDLSPWKTAVELEKAMLVDLMGRWAEHAVEAGTLVILEPLNGYETHLIKKLSDAVEICEQVNNPAGAKMMADFFHMELEEPDVATAIKEAGDWICHVHLADHPRILPGYGNSDFKPGFAALKEIGYDGYMALECGVPDPDKQAALTRTVEFLRSQM
ncbi:MAG: sugar phosphate isomerase/epimerase [Candidatus Latescibacteria bacterium]|nr:sugar phosphate isomerase/epimerase [Candidatus Latescibacterota bacterium]